MRRCVDEQLLPRRSETMQDMRVEFSCRRDRRHYVPWILRINMRSRQPAKSERYTPLHDARMINVSMKHNVFMVFLHLPDSVVPKSIHEEKYLKSIPRVTSRSRLPRASFGASRYQTPSSVVTTMCFFAGIGDRGCGNHLWLSNRRWYY